MPARVVLVQTRKEKVEKRFVLVPRREVLDARVSKEQPAVMVQEVEVLSPPGHGLALSECSQARLPCCERAEYV